MSILNKPYELSVWEDVWENDKFVEKRICVIGTEQMIAQCRALEPTLTQNVNGVKKFTFKMYRYYIDTVTGEKVENPFMIYLKSERKIKLKYDNTWYDFIIKDISENSSNYLYTYSLEDALVQELSKNGFGVTLDDKTNDNIGDARTLAESVLSDTDWTVESEALVERVEEKLVYTTIPAGTTITPLSDQPLTNLNVGVIPQQTITLSSDITVLAFYSCCTSRPHLFQFIYDANGYTIDEEGNIDNPNCQYYYVVNQPYDGQDGYKQDPTYEQFYFPAKWSLGTPPTGDTDISQKYRGKRYGFAQNTTYVSLLDRYCSEYKDASGIEYYGYVDNEYNSPIIIENFITNDEFNGTSGWNGTFDALNSTLRDPAKIEVAYGKFEQKTLPSGASLTGFESVVHKLEHGTFDPDAKYPSYLKIVFPEQESVVLNSGFDDKSYKLKEGVAQGEEWQFDITIVDSRNNDCTNHFLFSLNKVEYDPSSLGYHIRAQVASIDINSNTATFVNSHTAAELETTNIQLVIYPTNSVTINAEYYIESIKFHKRATDNQGNLNRPGDINADGVIKQCYYFCEKEAVENATDIKALNWQTVYKENINFAEYQPIYNEGAIKRRAINVKESNYFNILQGIAETFEAWLHLEITREDDGAIKEKKVHFKNYSGGVNYANFRYGVNLKDIQRTFASKELVTKLMVRKNSNQYAPHGYCSIAHANMNPSGEDYIYDFRYFHEMGLLDETQYLHSLYFPTNPTNGISQSGDDIPNTGDLNLQNYFNRVKAINENINDINDDILLLQEELVQYSAQLNVEEGLKNTSANTIADVSSEFFQTFSTQINDLEIEASDIVTCNIVNNLPQINYQPWMDRVTITPRQGITNTDWDFLIDIGEDWTEIAGIEMENDGYGEYENFKLSVLEEQDISTTGLRLDYGLDAHTEYQFTIKLTKLNNVKNAFLLLRDFDERTVTLVPEGSTNSLWYHQTLHNALRFDLYDTSTSVNYTDLTLTLTGVTNFENASIELFINNDFYAGVGSPTYGADGNCTLENITLSTKEPFSSEVDSLVYFDAEFTIIDQQHTKQETHMRRISIVVPANKAQWVYENYVLSKIDSKTSTATNLIHQYMTAHSQYQSSNQLVADLSAKVTVIQQDLDNRMSERSLLVGYKEALNKLFYKTYSRFVQEGTWLSEEYIDHDKYYIDALAVMYNSCRPKVSYTINVLSLQGVAGYELFNFQIGEKTYVEDAEFFGSNYREEVIITERIENLDDPTKDTIKVQNFKNQFQDLFQKITATVQQAQYNSGLYKRGGLLATADAKTRSKFVQDSLLSASSALIVGGQATVVSDSNGITITDSNTGKQLRLVGGAIMFRGRDTNGVETWKTGLTPDGISASLINTGTLNTKELFIYNVDKPYFKWDANGISAFAVDNSTGNPNESKFVRFDQYGIYGISNKNSDWAPTNGLAEIDTTATFALTWQGLKVTTDNKAVLTIGNSAKVNPEDRTIFKVTDKDGNVNMQIDEDGGIELKQGISWGADTSPTQAVYATLIEQNGQWVAPNKPADGAAYSAFPYVSSTNGEWHRKQDPSVDRYVSYTYDGGNTWGAPILAIGQDGKQGEQGVQGEQGPRGEQGENGEDAILAYIESSAGTLFEEKQSGQTTLTARLYQGTVDISNKYSYRWFVGSEEQTGEVGYQITLDIDKIKNQEVYFIASEKG